MEFFIDQVDLHQEIDVAQDLLTGPRGHQVMVLAEDRARSAISSTISRL